MLASETSTSIDTRRSGFLPEGKGRLWRASGWLRPQWVTLQTPKRNLSSVRDQITVCGQFTDCSSVECQHASDCFDVKWLMWLCSSRPLSQVDRANIFSRSLESKGALLFSLWETAAWINGSLAWMPADRLKYRTTSSIPNALSRKCQKRRFLIFVDLFFHPIRFWGHCQNIASFFPPQGSGSSLAPH